MVALGERSTPNGQELLAEFIQYGHQKPFEEIVRRYAGMVFNVCYRITKDKHEAEDATQAVFLTLALQAKRGTDIKALGPWLQQVAKRLSLDTRRSKKRRLTREERHHAEQTVRRESLLEDTLPSPDLDELKTILHEELQKLPAKYRMPLILHYFGGLTRDEMAAELNCKPSTLGVRIFRGREMLAGRLSSRGIHISAGVLAAALGYAVKRAISDTLIASTSHAATAMMAGHDGSGFASAHVIGLTRRATSALALGKVRVAAISLMIAGTSLGAGAKALGILPQIDVRQMITDQIKRMVRPLVEPLTQPLRVDAQPQTAKAPAVADANPTRPIDLSNLIAHANPPRKTTAKPDGGDTDSGNNGGILIGVASAPARSAWTNLPANHSSDPTLLASSTTDRSDSSKTSNPAADPADLLASSGSSSGGGTGGGFGNGAADYHIASPLPSSASSQNSFHVPDVILGANNLYIGSPASSQNRSLANSTTASASPASLIQIPALGGSVTESSDGIVRGWGTISRTGTIQNNGLVVADGQGVDRTLNLTSFSSIQTAAATAASSPNSAGTANTSTATSIGTATNSSAVTAVGTASIGAVPCTIETATISPPICGDGWYAINHGRLSLPLFVSASDPSNYTWGDDPNAAGLNLVNSVRISTSGSTSSAMPADLSLLSIDRSDVPSISEISGAAIGLWQVDPNGPDLASADLLIDYNSVLADELGASPDSVQLWTYSDQSDVWQAVSPSSFSLDTTDHLVSGYGTDISYFAVSVDPAPGQNVEDVLASHLDQVSGTQGGSVQGVPEPIGLPLLILGGTALLGRRRRGSRPA